MLHHKYEDCKYLLSSYASRINGVNASRIKDAIYPGLISLCPYNIYYYRNFSLEYCNQYGIGAHHLIRIIVQHIGYPILITFIVKTMVNIVKTMVNIEFVEEKSCSLCSGIIEVFTNKNNKNVNDDIENMVHESLDENNDDDKDV